MISYDDCKKVLDIFPNYPTAEFTFFAYKNGETKQFSSNKEALGFSQNIEKVQVNEEEYKEKRKLYFEDCAKVDEYWMSELRKEFDISDKLFDVCYSEAYDRGHSAGYHEVYIYMIEVVEFAEKIITANAEEKYND